MIARKLGPLTQLQDARYGAAVGFTLISFSLSRGDNRKMPGNSIWGMMQWLDGPQFVIDLNPESFEELENLGENPHYVGLSWADFEAGKELVPEGVGLILYADTSISANEIAERVTAYEGDLKIEVLLENPAPYESVAEHVILHFQQLDQAETFLGDMPFEPFGIAIGSEAEEAPDELDYERLDDIMAVFGDVHL